MKNKNNIKSAILVLAFCMAVIVGANAQIYLSPEDLNDRDPSTDDPNGFVLPDLPWDHDSTLDWTPIGNGIWLLGGLARAYLLGKRNKKSRAN